MGGIVMEEQTAVPSLDEQKKSAIDHYDEISTKAHNWHSIVPIAINFYFEAKKKEQAEENN